MPVKPAQGVRARARAALTDEIKQAATRQIAQGGAAGISLRAIARELGMASSALYRYYSSRDELLTALIVDAYNDVADAAEQAVREPGDFVAHWVAMASGIRDWARAHPHDYALIYGSPVPGYRAPTETVPAAARVALVALGLLDVGVRTGQSGLSPCRPFQLRSKAISEPWDRDWASRHRRTCWLGDWRRGLSFLGRSASSCSAIFTTWSTTTTSSSSSRRSKQPVASPHRP